MMARWRGRASVAGVHVIYLVLPAKQAVQVAEATKVWINDVQRAFDKFLPDAKPGAIDLTAYLTLALPGRSDGQTATKKTTKHISEHHVKHATIVPSASCLDRSRSSMLGVCAALLSQSTKHLKAVIESPVDEASPATYGYSSETSTTPAHRVSIAEAEGVVSEEGAHDAGAQRCRRAWRWRAAAMIFDLSSS